MAGFYLTATNAMTSIGTSVTKTLLSLLAASNDRIRVQAVTVSMNGTSATDPPALITICRQPPAGGTTSNLGAAYGIQPKSQADTNSSYLTTQTTAKTWSTEPTTNTIIKQFYVHPQTSFTYIFPTGQEELVDGANYFGVRITTGSSFSPTAVTCDIDFEE